MTAVFLIYPGDSMKKYISIVCVFILLVLFTSGCREHGTISLSEIEEKDGLYYRINEKKPFTGKLIDFYGEDKKKIEEFYQDGKIEGKSIYWYDNGQMKFDLTLENGNGKKIGWYRTGQKKYEVGFRDWKANGKYIELYKSGKKKFEVNYKSGKADGKFTEWEENGWIKSEGYMEKQKK